MPSSAAAQQVDAYIESLPQPQQAFAQKLRELLFELVPGIEERFSFSLPFYHYYGMFCYLHAHKNQLHFCICRGRDLTAAFPQLQQKNRASIASVTIDSRRDFASLEISTLIIAAAEWNKEAAGLKIPVLKKGPKQH
jgi:hypothetical protein